ncbi:hypothetical protein KP17_19195 [Pectobacterium parvum]|nr:MULTISPECIES: hypothetical protein [Pectobacterium]KFX10307.1 hypothetical protein KP17_19195 [Pectobacterium parvum]GKW36712.1 hypothetical protein PEC301875_07360 [Pectobacterium carotovorum subsp. carotovorum]
MQVNDEVEDLLVAAIDLAAKYKKLTGKPLGITGEVAEFYAAKLLGLKLMEARSAGYDAIGSDARKIQIKGRSLADSSKPGQRVGAIRLEHEWDSVILVLMDDVFTVKEMWEAYRPEVTYALLAPGSKSRNERGSLSISKFKQIGRKVWPVVGGDDRNT